jgi:hypothetical protein
MPSRTKIQMGEKSSNATGGCLLLVSLAVAAGYPQFQEYRERTAVAAKKERETAERAVTERTATERAIELAKNAHILPKGRLYTSKPHAETITNDDRLRRMMSEMGGGDLRVRGWEAKRHDADIFVVTYSYIKRGQIRAYAFEVNVTARVVRSIIGDPELEAKYGWRASADP